MNILKDVKLKWWQVGIFKLCLLSFGIAVGATWSDSFINWTMILWSIFVVTAIYLIMVRWKAVNILKSDGKG